MNIENANNLQEIDSVCINNNLIASFSNNCNFKVWNYNLDIILNINIPRGEISLSRCINISNDNSILIVTYNYSYLAIYDLIKCKFKTILLAHSLPISKILFSKNNSFFITASNDQTIIFWDFNTYDKIKTLSEHKNIITDISISNDEKIMVSSSFDKSIIIWDIVDFKIINKITFEKIVQSVAINDNYKIFIGLWSDNIQIIDGITSKNIYKIKLPEYSWFRSLEITKDNKKLVACLGNKQTILYNLKNKWDIWGFIILYRKRFMIKIIDNTIDYNDIIKIYNDFKSTKKKLNKILKLIYRLIFINEDIFKIIFKYLVDGLL